MNDRPSSRPWLNWIALALTGVLAGLVAAFAMLLTMAAARNWLGISPPPEAFPDRFAPTLNIDTFFGLLDRFGGYNGLKRFGVRTGIQTIVGAGVVFGLLYALVAELGRSRRAPMLRFGISRNGLVFIAASALVIWISSVVVLWPVLDANYRGLPPSQARWVSVTALLGQYAIFGLCIVSVYHSIARPRIRRDLDQVTPSESAKRADLPEHASSPEIRVPLPRRALLGGAVAAGLALAGNALFERLYDRATFAYDGRPYSGPGVEPITPNDKFYSVTKNVIDPNVSTRVWGLEINGFVDSPMRVDFAELESLSSTEQETTLMCISNRIGSGLFSNAVWTGVPMRDLLEMAGVRSGAVEVMLHGADAYTDTFTIEKALEPSTMVVYLMNGEPLPEKHGYPARAIVPGLYGEKSVKWVTRIEVLDHEAKGFYEQQGWGPNFVVPTRSDIFSPLWRRSSGGDNFVDSFLTGQVITVRGRAFAGARGIASVEASTDDGATWTPVRIDYPGTTRTWTFWSFDWVPDAAGEYVITSRAVDGEGEPQISEVRGIVPEGATGHHRVRAQVL
jgi:DMSO/TMAO reductase YedYZ molybdopterin-dependent catalytic subunit